MLQIIKKEKPDLSKSDLIEKLYNINFCPDTKSHIQVNQDICRICKGKECTRFCPSGIFTWSNIDDSLIIAYENCLECGACSSGCPYENIQYQNPTGGYGVS